MSTSDKGTEYFVWTNGKTAEGPFELPALITRIKQGNVSAKSWVFSDGDATWQPAGQIAELKMFFRGGAPGSKPGGDGSAPPVLRPGSLRRIKILADMGDTELEHFVRFVEVLQLRQFSEVVKKGQHGDAMFLVLEGELRVRTLIDGKESTLATLGPGEFFGEISLLDQGPRSADVLANRDSTVLKITAAAISKILREAPAAAAPFLHSLSRSVAGRMRNLTKRYEDSIHISRVAAKIDPND